MEHGAGSIPAPGLMTSPLDHVREAVAGTEAARVALRDAIVLARAVGEAVPAIADAAGVTRQRVYQVIREAETEEAELRARLAVIDAEWDGFIASMTDRPGDFKRVTALQNGYARRLARRGTGWDPISVTMRDYAESQALAVLESRRDDPRVELVVRKLDEAAAIRKRLLSLDQARAGFDVA